MKITAVPMKIDMPELNLGGNLGNNKTKPNWTNNKLK
jgi:hypothetical protein